MSSYPTFTLKGMRSLDGEFYKMIAVRDACVKAGVPVPEEVYSYFGINRVDVKHESAHYLMDNKFSENIIKIDGGSGDLDERETNTEIASLLLNADMHRRFLVDLSKLPTAVETLLIDITW